MSNKMKLRLAALGALVILFSFFVGFEIIDAGSVGIKVDRVGGARGASKTEYVNGFQFYFRGVSKIYEYPVNQQPTEYKTSEDKPEDFVVAAKGGTPFIMHPSFSVAVNPNKVDSMFTQLRQPLDVLIQGFVKNALKQSLREVTNTFTPDSIINSVSVYDAAVIDDLNHRLHPYFMVSQYTSNMIPDEALRNAIKAKALAIQEAQTIENQQKKIKAQVENDLLEATRDSAVKVKAALADARSIREKQQVITPQYVEYIKWLNAGEDVPRVPTTVLGSSTGFIYNPK